MAAFFDLESERPEASDRASLIDGVESSGFWLGFEMHGLVYHLPSSSGRIHTLKNSVDLLTHWNQNSSSAKTRSICITVLLLFYFLEKYIQQSHNTPLHTQTFVFEFDNNRCVSDPG